MNSTIKLAIRRIGSSQGVLLPKAVITTWGVGVGDYLLLDEQGISPPPKKNSRVVLDEFKRSLSLEVLPRFTLDEIRMKSRENLSRWKMHSAWATVYDEWSSILNGPDDALVKAMIGHDDRSNRLRQSTPYVACFPKT